MLHHASTTAIVVFALFVLGVLALSFWLGRRAKSAGGYFAAHGQVGWFVNGIAFAGDYLSAASFLGICGMIAFYGYDGFLYSIGYLAGWIVALLVIAEPIKRLGKFTFADALDARFNSRSIKLAAAISTLVVSIFYLIPQMVGAGALVTPLLGLAHLWGVIIVGSVVTVIVVTAGMVSTTWVQFIKGSLLVLFCAMLTIAILARGLTTGPAELTGPSIPPERSTLIPPEGGWIDKPYQRYRLPDGGVLTYRVEPAPASAPGTPPNTQGSPVSPHLAPALTLTQTLTVTPGGQRLVNGVPQGSGPGEADLAPVGHVARLPPGYDGQATTGPLGPLQYISAIGDSVIVTWRSERITATDGSTTVYYQVPVEGEQLLVPGASPTFAGVRKDSLFDKLDFISLMLALFAGTASLPHILIRYYTVKDAAAARKSTVVGIAAIGFFYVLTLYLGLGAMTSGRLDPTNSNMAAPLLAKAFGELPFAMISAIAFTTVLGTVSGLILASTGAIAHDLMENVLGFEFGENGKVAAAKIATVGIGVIAMVLGVVFEKLNVTFLVGWAFNVAASANLPALVMLLFWKRTTRQGIVASILVGLSSSLTWLLLTGPAYANVYGLPASSAPAPFTQPGIVTIPLAFLTLVVVSLATPKQKQAAA